MTTAIPRLRKFTIAACATTMVGLLAAVPASAQQEDDSYFRITPYLWMLGLDGTTAVLGQDADVDASFSDILDVLNIALSANMEWNNGKWFLILDPMWADLEMDFQTPDPLPISGNIEIELWIVDALVGLELTENFDVYTGGRYYNQDITIIPSLAPSVGLGDDWTDFILGVRAHTSMNDNWSLSGKIDAAVAGDSDSAIYAQAVFMRHFGENKHLDLGYRYYAVDYESGSGLNRFLWDVAHSGPVVGFSWEF
jgi:hypothetical protein